MGIDPMGELRALGYEYKGTPAHLCQIGTDKGFEFRSSEHYDSLAEAVVRYVALLLEDEAALKPVWLPIGIEAGEGCPIFATTNFEEAERLLVVIGGHGRVRAGVWGCALCINKDLEWGTALPYLHKASRLNGVGLLVLNTNENKYEGKPIQGSETSERHVSYVWEHIIVARCRASIVDVVAHSYGGKALVSLMSRSRAGDGLQKLHRVAFTDSYHTKQQVSQLPERFQDLLKDPSRVVNYVPHGAPLGTMVPEWRSQEYLFTQDEKGCACISAGTEDHASTNHAVLEPLFAFLYAPIAARGLGDEEVAEDGYPSPRASRRSRHLRTAMLSLTEEDLNLGTDTNSQQLLECVRDELSEESGQPKMVTATRRRRSLSK